MVMIADGPFDSEDEDKGIVAKDRLAMIQKGKQLMKRLLMIYIVIASVILVGIPVTSWNIYKQHSTEWRTDYHMCYVKLGSTVLEGQRAYRYEAASLMGYRWLKSEGIEETTRLKPTGLPYRLIGMKDGKEWTYSNEISSKNPPQLKDSDYYIFITTNEIKVVSYKDFCGIPKPSES